MWFCSWAMELNKYLEKQIQKSSVAALKSNYEIETYGMINIIFKEKPKSIKKE